MTHDTEHLPSPEFRAQLEWDVMRTLRRERSGGRLRAAAMIALCIGLGSVSGFASAQVRDVTRRNSLLQEAELQRSLIGLSLEITRARVAEVVKQIRVGAAGPEALIKAEAEQREVETRLQRAQLNMEEIRATYTSPRDEITAPLVGNRDFVQERIQLELSNLQYRLTAAERELGEVKRRFDIGVVGESARIEAEVEVARARAALAAVMDRRTLRREFLEKQTPAEELVTRMEISQVRWDLEVAQEMMRLAKARMETVQKQRAVGVATELEVMRAQIEVRERELEMKQLTLRRQRLEQVRDDLN